MVFTIKVENGWHSIDARNLHEAVIELQKKGHKIWNTEISNSVIHLGAEDSQSLFSIGIEYMSFTNCIISLLHIKDYKNKNIQIRLDSCVVENLHVNGCDIDFLNLKECAIKSMAVNGNNISYLDIDRSASLCRGVVISYNKINKFDILWSSMRESEIRDNEIGRLCNLLGTDFFGSIIKDIYIDKAGINTSTRGLLMACPEEGSFIGYKKCIDGKIVTLLIPEDAKRSSSTTNKCRCSKCKVLKIEDPAGNPAECEYAESLYYDTVYKVGETIEVSDFDENRWAECSTGIHFFMNKRLAEVYG